MTLAPGPNPIKSLQRKFFVTLLFQAFLLATQIFRLIRMLTKNKNHKIYTVKFLYDRLQVLLIDLPEA